MTDEQEVVQDEDESPRIVILGAGPIGLEAALYARYLGYEVAVLEKNKVGSSVLRWGHVRMFSPFAMNRSSLGVAAMQAHYEGMSWPADNATLTGREFADVYLLPLSKTDLLSGCIHEQVEVIGVARDGILKTDTTGVERDDYQLRVLVRSKDGEDIIDADYVIDTTGVFDQPSYLGHGGLPAIGELELRDAFVKHVPDVLGNGRAKFEGKRILVVGSGYSAATNIIALAELHRQTPATHTTWLTRRESFSDGPMPVAADDSLPERKKLAELANAAATTTGVTHIDQSAVLSISRNDEGRFQVTLGGKAAGEHEFDAIISSTGYRPNTQLTRELQIERCSATEAPKPMSEWLASLGPIDAIEQTAPGSDVLRNLEPNFFVLGSKSFGRNSNFLLSLGLQQVRDAFMIIADREDLDLYKTMSSLV